MRSLQKSRTQIREPAIDRRTINSVLFTEGRDYVSYDEATHTYRLNQPAGEQQ